jgi:hypothetical protein
MAEGFTDEEMGLAPAPAPSKGFTDREMGITAPPAAVSSPQERPMTLQERSQDVYGFEDLAERGTLLPVGETQGGDFTVATPQFLKDMLESALLPGHVAKGGSYEPEDATRFTLDWLAPATQKRWPDMKAPMTASRLRETAPETEDLKRSALSFQSLAKETGVVIKPEAQNRLVSNIVKVADDALATPGVHDKTIAAIKSARRYLGGAPSVEGVIRQRQVLQAAREGARGQDRELVRKMIAEYDRFIDALTPDDLIAGKADNVGKNLAKFRSLWTKASKSEEIEGIIGDANVAASGFENGLRSGFRSLFKNKERLRSFSPAEQQAIEEIAMGKGANLYKLIGKYGFGLKGNNMLGGTIGTAGGAAAGGPAGAALVPMLGAWAGAQAERVTMDKALTVRAMAATGRVPQNPVIMKLLENALTKRGAGPVLGTGIKTPDRQQGTPVTMPDGSTVYLDPNIL